MYDALVTKMIGHFGKEGIILNSKANDYYKLHPITMEDIKMYYDFLLTDNPFPQNFSKVPRINQISCCLYYLSKNNPQLQERFCHQIIEALKPRTDSISDSYLCLIYNVIEFDEKYLSQTRSRNKVSFLLGYLERFSTHPKTIGNFLLYKYYRGILKLQLGDLVEANTEYLETIMSLNDDVKRRTHYIEFISLKNDLFKVKLSEFQKEDDLPQQGLFLSELSDKVKKDNKILAIKLGLGLYDNYYKQFKFNKCFEILAEMRDLLKKGLYHGSNMLNGLDFYLDIATRLGFLGILTNDKTQIIKAQKKINKVLTIIESDKDEKLITLKVAYSFINLIYKINCKSTVSNSKEIAAAYRSKFLPNPNSQPTSFIVNNLNINENIINLNTINNMDPDISSYSKSLLQYCYGNISKKVNLQSNMELVFILGIHGNIKYLSESFCSDPSPAKKDEYKQKICDAAKYALNYVKGEINNDCSLVKTAFVKSALIEIFSAYSHVYIYDQDLEKLKALIQFFDDLCRSLRIDESIESFDLVLKIKGDYWRMSHPKNFLDSSEDYYSKALNIMRKDNPRRGVVYFNLGCVNFFRGKKNSAIENINRAINEFNHITPLAHNELLDFYIKIGDVNKKKEIAQNMLTYLNSGK